MERPTIGESANSTALIASRSKSRILGCNAALLDVVAHYTYCRLHQEHKLKGSARGSEEALYAIESRGERYWEELWMVASASYC